jgi:hypothetical protein
MADISITAASFIPSTGATVTDGVTAGAALTRGMPLYYDSTNTNYKALDVTNTSKDTLAGFAMEDVGTGQRFSICTLDPALALGGTCASGDTIWCSATGVTKTIGDLTAGWRIIVVGVATAANTVNFKNTRGGVK